mmetsp:Transcript_22624/g.59100  ORF Transcript_22624/g.59100 Transcript_22624/m.59100 type:complete len:98 (-) Transcript_22624:1862-2155(-)
MWEYLDAMEQTGQSSMSISGDLGLVATKLAPMVWANKDLRDKLMVHPGIWHCAENFLKGQPTAWRVHELHRRMVESRLARLQRARNFVKVSTGATRE